MSERETDEETGVETTGHEWDGIRELNNPLPRWWLWTLYITIIWGIGYTIAFPAWPMLSGATKGLLGYSTRAEVAEQIVAHKAKNQALETELLNADLASLTSGTNVHRYGVARGGAVFRAQCSQCHGSGAAGAKGYPNLLDDDWLWGGSLEVINFTIDHGVRNDTDDDAHYSEMPAYDEILEDAEISAVVEFVFGLSSREHDAPLAAVGAEIYQEHCGACHKEDATGNREFGAPNLADAIWLFGGGRAAIEQTIRHSRFGVMPAWGQRLSDADVRAVSLYVHALGGGE